MCQASVPHQPPHLHGQSHPARGTGTSFILGQLGPAKILLCTHNCSAASLLLLLGVFLFSLRPTIRFFLFLTALRTFTVTIKGTEKFRHSIRAGNSFKGSRENSPFIFTSNQKKGSSPTALWNIYVHKLQRNTAEASLSPCPALHRE